MALDIISRPRRRTGQDENRRCCSCYPRCSCCGWQNAASSVCCSRNRPGSRAGRLAVQSPLKDYLTKDALAQAFRVGMTGMTDPALHRRVDVLPIKTRGLRPWTPEKGKSKKIKGLVFNVPGKTKTKVDVPVNREVPVAVGRTQLPRFEEPGAAPDHAHVAVAIVRCLPG